MAPASNPRPSAAPEGIAALRATVAELCLASTEFPVRDYEEEDGAPSAVLLRDATRAFLERALEAVSAISSCYAGGNDASRAASADGVAKTRGAVNQDARRARAILDVAFVARMALRSRIDVVQEPSLSRMQLVAATGGALRATRKALLALDHAVARKEGLSISTDLQQRELARSLLVRRAYARFRSDFNLLEPPTPATIRARLRMMGTIIARTIGSKAYADIRSEDRMMLLSVRRRILACLMTPADDLEAGRSLDAFRVWQEASNIAQLFWRVNLREELIRHDSLLVAGVRATMEAGEWSWGEQREADALEDLRRRLSSLMGRDPELDALLLAPAGVTTPPALLACLARVQAQLGPDGQAPELRGSAPPPPPSAFPEGDTL